MSNPIRVLIADDHAVVRAGLALIVRYQLGSEFVIEASNGAEAAELFRHHQPDIALIDLRMPIMDGVEAITAIRQEFQSANLIILTSYDGDEDIYRGLHAGAMGYLLKGTSADELVKAIQTVLAGRKYIPNAIATKLLERMEQSPLSDRECTVLQLVSKGMSNQKVAVALGVSESTIKFHLNNILSKLQARDRTEAVVIALRRGIIKF